MTKLSQCRRELFHLLLRPTHSHLGSNRACYQPRECRPRRQHQAKQVHVTDVTPCLEDVVLHGAGSDKARLQPFHGSSLMTRPVTSMGSIGLMARKLACPAPEHHTADRLLIDLVDLQGDVFIHRDREQFAALGGPEEHLDEAATAVTDVARNDRAIRRPVRRQPPPATRARKPHSKGYHDCLGP